MRRHPKFGSERFFLQFPDARWVDLPEQEKRFFITKHWRWLAEHGLGPAGQLVFSFIYFDCTSPNHRILADLDIAIRKPPALVHSETHYSKPPPGKGEKRKHPSKPRQTNSQCKWEPTPHPDSPLIRYKLPAKAWCIGGKQSLTAQEALANLKTFLDNPPADFKDHRREAKQHLTTSAKAPPQDIFTLGLMDYDCRHFSHDKDLEWVLGWLTQQFPNRSFPNVESAMRSLRRYKPRFLGLIS
jgi:hypothetical protein